MIDDNPTDVLLTRRALSETGIPHELQVAGDGEEGLNVLFSLKASRAEPPDLILLDLNMPRKDGFEVLTEMRALPNIGRIPVIVLTSSQAQEDVLTSYRLHANCFITKPGDLETLILVAQSIEQFWFKLVRLPAGG